MVRIFLFFLKIFIIFGFFWLRRFFLMLFFYLFLINIDRLSRLHIFGDNRWWNWDWSLFNLRLSLLHFLWRFLSIRFISWYHWFFTSLFLRCFCTLLFFFFGGCFLGSFGSLFLLLCRLFGFLFTCLSFRLGFRFLLWCTSCWSLLSNNFFLFFTTCSSLLLLLFIFISYHFSFVSLFLSIRHALIRLLLFVVECFPLLSHPLQ